MSSSEDPQPSPKVVENSSNQVVENLNLNVIVDNNTDDDDLEDVHTKSPHKKAKSKSPEKTAKSPEKTAKSPEKTTDNIADDDDLEDVPLVTLLKSPHKNKAKSKSLKKLQKVLKKLQKVLKKLQKVL